MDIIHWLGSNYEEILAAAWAVVLAGEAIVRLTPTKKDDGFVQRVGEWIKKAMDWAKVPNTKKK